MDQNERNRIRKELRSPFRWILDDQDLVRRCPLLGQGNVPLYLVALMRDHLLTRHAEIDDGAVVRGLVSVCDSCENSHRCSEPGVYWKSARRAARALNAFRMKMERDG